jgi:hypothetical protein
MPPVPVRRWRRIRPADARDEGIGSGLRKAPRDLAQDVVAHCMTIEIVDLLEAV